MPESIMPALTQELVTALLSVDRLKVKEILTQHASKTSPFELVEKIIVPALVTIGDGWETGLFSLSQVYMSGRVCEEMVDQILPASDQSRRLQPKAAIVVLEDYHLLGMRIVYSALRASGFEVTNYGRLNVDETAARVKQDQIKILLISVLMLPAALKVKELRNKFLKEGVDVKMIVGGAPFRFDDHLWQAVGADGCGKSASEAVALMDKMMEVKL